MAPLPGATENSFLIRRDTNQTSGSLGNATGPGSWQGGMSVAGVGVIAMVVSDSGLASTEPQWWNASPLGCILIGLQPRGGWQILQRGVQWGTDTFASAFGVSCPEPILFCHFATTIRNRIEVWNTPRVMSPMENKVAAEKWTHFPGRCEMKRPSKLVDGSRGGQAFMCQLLRPEEGAAYSIVAQARMQMLSVMFVAASLMKDDGVDDVDKVFEEDFQVGGELGSIFLRLERGLIVVNIALVFVIVAVFYDLWARNIFSTGSPYVLKLTSFAAWAIGSVGILMLGGNPRVARKKTDKLPKYIEERIAQVLEETGCSKDNNPKNGIDEVDEKEVDIKEVDIKEVDEKEVDEKEVDEKEVDKKEVDEKDVKIQVNFGSLHGSVFTLDYGHCFLSPKVIRLICSYDLQLIRPRGWYVGMFWGGFLLALSIILQIAGSQSATVGSEIVGIIILISTAVLRGIGLSGPEEWQIPRWKKRKNANYGAVMVGLFTSRASAA
ncbi:hypothetical protein FPQ18DRAFT_398856 [Pyronema domesticum]|uniref:Uncharacterized protein n=1 Tax=Pyronema omphalodes (strain CBS 100304) TaxID=1076935 RepID=U4LE24_PYROM|nr:hypothetical protein FPQ18DRAFT_398856 [Pyronema domesticum]CCX30344.1 Similar to predicted protein [Laccaria bicolor S238N-H82]; acc. no. XP_001874379 [Pyronema omphalodes CBS 100304]